MCGRKELHILLQSQSYVDEIKKKKKIIIKLLLNQVIDMFFLFYYIQRIIRDIFAMISIHGSLVIQCMESDTN